MLIVVVLAFAFPASAKDDVFHKIRKVANTVAPGSTIVVDTVEKRDPSKAVNEGVKEQTRIIVSTGQKVAAIDQGLEDKLKVAVGPDLGKLVEIVRLPQKLETAIVIQTVATVGAALEKQKVDLKEVGAIPLAAALEQAIALYKSRAQPMPEGMKVLLATTFDAAALENVRFVIDDNLGSLPGAINALKEHTVDNHAVTVGNIIVFAKDPGLNAVHFWAHETQHTVQYNRLGVARFAAKYIADFAELEKEAEDAANRADKDAEVILRFIAAQAAALKH